MDGKVSDELVTVSLQYLLESERSLSDEVKEQLDQIKGFLSRECYKERDQLEARRNWFVNTVKVIYQLEDGDPIPERANLIIRQLGNRIKTITEAEYLVRYEINQLAKNIDKIVKSHNDQIS